MKRICGLICFVVFLVICRTSTAESASLQPATLSVQPYSNTMIAGKGENILIKVLDTSGNPLANQTVTLSISGQGTVPSSATTDSDGEAIVSVNDNKAEDIRVSAALGDLTSSATIHVLPDQPISIDLIPDSAALFAGQSGTVTISLRDQYGNLVPHTIINLSTTSKAIIPNQVETDARGQAVILVHDKKAENVTITAQMQSSCTPTNITGTTSINFQPTKKQVASITVHPESNTVYTSVYHSGTTTVTLLVTDAEGNPVADAPISLAASGNATIPAQVTSDSNGQATFSLSDDSAEIVTITATASNGVAGTAQVQFIALTPITDKIIIWNEEVNPDGSISVFGTIYDESWNPCPDIAIPMQISGGETSNPVPISDESGNFSFVVTPSDQSTVSVSVPSALNAPTLITQSLSGGDTIDSGIDLLPGDIVEISNSNGVTAQINGTSVNSSIFSVGTGGRLFLTGSGITKISIQHPCSCNHFTIYLKNYKASPDKIWADGKSTSKISGQLVAVFMIKGSQIEAPIIGANVSLSLSNSNGQLTQSVVTTDENGNFSTTYTVGTTSGTVNVNVKFGTINQDAIITLVKNSCTPPSSLEGVSPPIGTVVTASSSAAPAKNAIDGCSETPWNSGGYSGTLQLQFPYTVTLSGVHLAAQSTPNTNETYTIYGLQDGNWIQISDAAKRTVTGTVTYLNPIAVTVGKYDGIKITVNGGASWVAIHEVLLIESQ